MAPDDNSGARPTGPVVLRIKLRYDDVDAMVQRFASNVGKSGLFLPTKSIQPVGTEVKFELRLANDTPVLVGLGRVKHVRHPDPDNPRAAFGIGLELMRVSREGREVILKMLERRRAMGLPEVAIPVPEDLEAARRAEVETQPRAESAGVVRDVMAQVASAPSLLTSARPGSGAIAVARGESSALFPVPVLAPEKSRPRRPQVQDLIDKATELSSRIVVSTPELDMHVDVDRVLSRARALAGGELDVELAMLREAAAAPVEISVEAASAQLARQLGGKAISKREKSAPWTPPRMIETRSGPVSTSAYAAKLRAPIAEIPPHEPDSHPELELKTPPDPSPSLVPQEAYVIRRSAELVAQADAEYDDAFATNPSTTTAVEPEVVAKTFGPSNEVKTDPADARRMMIDDDADVSSFERALDAARIHTGVSAPAPERPGDRELDDEEDQRAQLLASGEYQLDDAQVERTQIAAPIHFPSVSDQLANQLDEQLAEAEREAAREIAEGIGVTYDQEQEISDLDVLAEADEDDEDLLAAHGEAEVSGGHEVAPTAYEPNLTPQPGDDFASRLDLGDDDEAAPPSDDIDRDAAREFDAHVAEPAVDHREPAYVPDAPDDYRGQQRAYNYQRARRASSEGSADYTLAESVAPSMHFAPHATGEEFDEPHGYSAPPPAAPASGPDPRLLQHGRPTTSASDLEDALATLDVGDIDLEQQRRRLRRPTPSASRPLPGLPIERPKTGPVPVTPAAPAQQSGPVRRVAHTVPRNTGAQPIVQPAHPTGPQMLAHDPEARQKPPTGQQPVQARPKPPTGQVSTAKPPPIPAAARKPATQQVPLVKVTQPAPVVNKRPSTDEGVLIDFDDDE